MMLYKQIIVGNEAFVFPHAVMHIAPYVYTLFNFSKTNIAPPWLTNLTLYL